jgi:preprotein translocase subunit Sss1
MWLSMVVITIKMLVQSLPGLIGFLIKLMPQLIFCRKYEGDSLF